MRSTTPMSVLDVRAAISLLCHMQIILANDPSVTPAESNSGKLALARHYVSVGTSRRLANSQFGQIAKRKKFRSELSEFLEKRDTDLRKASKAFITSDLADPDCSRRDGDVARLRQ